MSTTTKAAGSTPQPYPSLPASPTLTNPDMILPDYDRTSSPIDLNQDRSQSPLMMWKNAYAANSSSELHQLFAVSDPTHLPSSGPITPTTPIIYGNGTMLSDIGEVTEVESTPGKPSPARRRDPSVGEDALRSSPTMGLEAVKKLVRKKRSRDLARRSSLDSDSTITTQDQSALFADFDDSISVGDSVFQGDDEESVAESYIADDSSHLPLGASQQGPLHFDARGDGSADRQSAYLLSQRAEKILANAKRRLTTMEGNLNRARSSLHTSSPSISSLGSDATTPSPTLPFRSTSSDDREAFKPLGHTRMGSDNTLRIGLPVKVYTQRSASALGAAGGYRQPLTSSRSVDQIRDRARAASLRPSHKLPSAHDSSLQPLSEGDDDISLSRAHISLLQPSNRSSAQLEGFLSPTFGPAHDGAKVIARSASTHQMRDLRDQVNDLKGKISSLRDQARADSLRRRSFQSLRTPSPFTHAQVEQWYAEPASSANPVEDPVAASTTQSKSWRNEEISKADGDNDGDNIVGTRGGENAHVSSGSTPVSEPKSSPIDGSTEHTGDEHPAMLLPPDIQATVRDAVQPRQADAEDDEDDVSDMLTEDGDYGEEQYDTAEAPGYESESGESAYHDTLQHPISHEDREDAFDYEHFILHSALGTISQQRLVRGERGGSFSSEDSIETARGPAMANGGASQSRSFGRPGLRRSSSSSSSNSTATSIISFESFATADDGRRSRDSERRTADGDGPQVQSRTREPVAVSASGPSRDSTFCTSCQLNTEGGVEGGSNRVERKDSPPVATILRRPASSAATMTRHRPSVSSFESTGTMRSFPLVTRKKAASFTLSVAATGHHISSSEVDLRAISDSLMKDAAAVYMQQAGTGYDMGRTSPTKGTGSVLAKGSTPAAMQQLPREDQFLIERLVAGIGRCVLGLGEVGRASTESRMYRRRLDAARRILEGIDSA